MPEEHAFFDASPQSTILEDGESLIWYNWENGKHVVLGRDEIRPEKDADGRITRVEILNLSDDDLGYLRENSYILTEKRGMSYYRNALESYLKSLEDDAFMVFFPAGSRCNFRCRYCYENHDEGAVHSDDDTELFAYFISRFEGKRLDIGFFGGEPLMRPQWIISLLSKIDRRIRSSATTNGYLLTPELFQRLLPLGLRTYQITLDGLPEDHDSMRILYNGKGTWQRIYDNIRSTKDVREFFTILIRVNFNERSLDMAKLEKFFDLFSFARNDLRYRFCFRPIAPYSEINGRENSDSLACQCDEASGMRLLSDFNRYAQESGFFLSDPGFYSERGGLVCYASKINTYVVNVRREIQKCTVALDQGINKLSVLTRENIDSLTVRKASEDWDGNLDRLDPKCARCPLFFQCFGRNCALENITSGQNVCPCIVGQEEEIVRMVIMNKEMLRRLGSEAAPC